MLKQETKNVGWGRVLLLVLPYLFIVGIFQFIGASIAGVDLKAEVPSRTLVQQVIVQVFNVLGTFIVIGLFMQFVDRQKFLDLGFHTKNRGNNFNYGFALGGLIICSGYLLLTALNEIVYTQIVFDLGDFLLVSILFFLVSLAEETFLRGYILKNLMVSFNKYTALILSSILFASMHGLNPNIDLFSLINLFLAGILLGVTYIHTRNLWFPIGLHFSWNLFQSLLGFNVSGRDSYSIVEHRIVKDSLLNGGEFGFEGSILSVITQILAISAIVIYYHRSAKHSPNSE